MDSRKETETPTLWPVKRKIAVSERKKARKPVPHNLVWAMDLTGKTPAEVWNNADIFSNKARNKFWFEAWDGLLQGFYLRI